MNPVDNPQSSGPGWVAAPVPFISVGAVVEIIIGTFAQRIQYCVMGTGGTLPKQAFFVPETVVLHEGSPRLTLPETPSGRFLRHKYIKRHPANRLVK